ncbi:phage tail protein [Listeria sp. FSL L7-1582]|uniref:HK97-gp10 family putative phage morphogenesis protein n=1 Tax=Listeria portnoyi TaxID=2713504 RepID=UPI00164E051D|nr:HK97-gp10 family putative phage morphogenesis protein [Listeria portnoyi]MBC6310148.1 phage tail protein [Listeria portnoyi]
MSQSNVHVTSKNVDKHIHMLMKKSEKVTKKANAIGGKHLAEALERNTPYDPDGSKHLRDDVVFGADEAGAMTIGYGKATAYRAHFVNNGTENQTGVHHIEKTLETEGKKALDLMQAEVKKGLGL